MTNPRQSQRRLFLGCSALVGLALPVLLLLSLEFSIRHLHPWLPVEIKTAWIRFQLLRRSHVAHSKLVWALKPISMSYPNPRHHWSLRHIPFPNDRSFGYRGDVERSSADLVVLGDSFTYGFEVDQTQTWVARLEQASGLKAVNLAVTSYGSSQEALLYKLHGQTFQPRIVLQLLATNDPLDDVFFNVINAHKDVKMRNMCWFLGLKPGSWGCSSVSWITRNSVVGNNLFFQAHVIGKRRKKGDAAYMSQGTDMMCRDMASVWSLTKPKAIRYAVILMGAWNLEEFSAYRRTLETCMRDMGIPYLRLDDREESARRKNSFFGVLSRHWTPEGHRYVSGKALEFLRSLGWIRDVKGASWQPLVKVPDKR